MGERARLLLSPSASRRVAPAGFYLDKVASISFTRDNCLNSVLNVSHNEFHSQ